MRHTGALVVLLVGLLPASGQAATWDLGLSLPYFSGRMDAFLPVSVEMGVTSVKGYGVGYNFLTASTDERLQSQTEAVGTRTYQAELTLQSGTLELYYRFEQYVHRWDLGLMRQATQYEVVQQRTTNAVVTEQQASLEVVYLGPFLQYSNTWIGYDQQDAYYAVQLAALSRTTPVTETSLEFATTSDPVWERQQATYQQFVTDTNPEASVFVAFTVGWRL